MGFSQGQFMLPAGQMPAGRRNQRLQSHKLKFLDKKTLYCATKDIPLLPRPPQICGSVYQINRGDLAALSGIARPVPPRQKTVTND
jgi:hypothetical protein